MHGGSACEGWYASSSTTCVRPTRRALKTCRRAAPPPRRSAAGVDTPVAMSVVAAPSVLIEELPPQRGAAELGMDSAATGGYEAMEE